eukprot:m.1037747 g.1037747  ORF g.1037747 m.1037747 type:complete len:1084 (+) comp24145_c0_seq16:488-3739(+)
MSEHQGTLVPLYLALKDDLFTSYFNAFLTSPAFDFHLNYVQLGCVYGFINKSNIDEYARRRVNEALALETETKTGSIGKSTPTFVWVAQHRYHLFAASEYNIELELCRLLTAPTHAVLVTESSAPQQALGGWDQMQAFKEFIAGHSGGACVQFWLDVSRMCQNVQGSRSEQRAIHTILARYTRAGAPLDLPPSVRSLLPKRHAYSAGNGSLNTSVKKSLSPKRPTEGSHIETMRAAMINAQNAAVLQLRQYWVPRYVHAVSCVDIGRRVEMRTEKKEMNLGHIEATCDGGTLDENEGDVSNILRWAGHLPRPTARSRSARQSQPPCPTADKPVSHRRTVYKNAEYHDPLSALATAPHVSVAPEHRKSCSHASGRVLPEGDVSLDNAVSPAALSLLQSLSSTETTDGHEEKLKQPVLQTATTGGGHTDSGSVGAHMTASALLLTESDDTLRLRHDVEVGRPFGRHLVRRVRSGDVAPVVLHLYLFWCDVDALDHLTFPSATLATELASQVFVAHVDAHASYGIDVPAARREQLRALLSDPTVGRVGMYAHESAVALQSLHVELEAFLNATHQSFLRSMQTDPSFGSRQTEFTQLAKAPASLAEEQFARDCMLAEWAQEIFASLVLELSTTSIYRDLCAESIQDIEDGLEETLAGDAELQAAVEIALKGDKSEVHHCIAFLKAQPEGNPVADFLVWADVRAMVAIAKKDNSDAAVLRRCKAIVRVHSATHVFDEVSATAVLQAQKRAGQQITRHWMPLFLASPDYVERLSRKKQKRKKSSVHENDTLLEGLFKPLDGAGQDVEAFRKLLTKQVNVMRFQTYIEGLPLSEAVRRTTLCDLNFWIEVQKFKALAHRQHRCPALVFDKARAMIDMYLQFGPAPSVLRIGVSADAAASVKLKGRNTSATGMRSGVPDVSAYLFRQPEEQVFQTIFQHYAGFRVAKMEADLQPKPSKGMRMARLTRRTRSLEPIHPTGPQDYPGAAPHADRTPAVPRQTPTLAQEVNRLQLNDSPLASRSMRRTRSQTMELSPAARRRSGQHGVGGQGTHHDPNATRLTSTRTPFAVALNFSLQDGLTTVAQTSGFTAME